jgi:hypothetical protein
VYAGLNSKIGGITCRLEYNLSNEAAKVWIKEREITFRMK